MMTQTETILLFVGILLIGIGNFAWRRERKRQHRNEDIERRYF